AGIEKSIQARFPALVEKAQAALKLVA
ncbi:MAG: hypothetical protein JWP29_4824, partial [Rhodoferax sp.]|nr:hypothetical protein [Rhodoferax sp.]